MTAAPLHDRLFDAVRAVRERTGERLGGGRSSAGLILGSGLGSFADTLADRVVIPYADIPHFPVSTVEGHAGNLVVGRRGRLACVAMQGRAHCYEGHTAATVAFPARVLVALGARRLVITNASGGIRDDLAPGTLMLIRDHINLFPDHPLRGPNDDRLGPRFPDMTHAYDSQLIELARAAAERERIALAEGIYAASPGPTYETPAEVRMLRTLGADATGMSTVPEVIVANHMGAAVLGISCITNRAAGLGASLLSHDEVTETAARIRATFERLVAAILDDLAEASRDRA